MTEIFDKNIIHDVTILVIGDVMIDEYFFGTVSRLSPEAPVPVLDIASTQNSLGGAANVAANISSLGAKSIICSIVGNDGAESLLIDLFNAANVNYDGIIVSNSRRTTVKQRFISSGKQLLRVDTEDRFDISQQEENKLIERVRYLIEKFSPKVIILQDYNKGVLTQEVIRTTIKLAENKGIKVCVDPKKKNFTCYEGVYLFKPNEKELLDYADNTEMNDEMMNKYLSEFQKVNQIENMILTRGARGMVISSNFGDMIQPISAQIRQVADVTGAGDTVISTIALCTAMGMPIYKASCIANVAGGFVCEKVGVATITIEELSTELLKTNALQQ